MNNKSGMAVHGLSKHLIARDLLAGLKCNEEIIDL